MFKVINIENKAIPMKADGLTGRLYARYFGKDFISTFMKLRNLQNGGDADTGLFDELAWVLAKSANADIPDINEWLSQFNSPFSIFQKYCANIRCSTYRSTRQACATIFSDT